jgi:dTMP kinase
MKGIFITFEGPEGSGKTTVLEMIEKELISLGYKVKKTREPGGSKISEDIRKVILDVNNTEMDGVTEALLYAASRRQHLIEVVLPYLNDGYIVLCDRFIDSSLAYQGYARRLGIKEVYQINQFATGGLLPDLTIFIDVSPEVGLNRIATNHRNQNRLDLESIKFHKLVHEGYLEVQKMFPDRIKVINGEQDIPNVDKDVKNVILKFLESHYEL